MPGISDFVALLALMISVISVWLSFKSYADSAASGTIRSQYEDFANIVRAQIDHSQLIHLFTVPDSYATVRQQVMASIQDLSREDKLKVLLQERATADYIFNVFEQAYYQSKKAQPYLDKKSKRFYTEVLDYFTLRPNFRPKIARFQPK